MELSFSTVPWELESEIVGSGFFEGVASMAGGAAIGAIAGGVVLGLVGFAVAGPVGAAVAAEWGVQLGAAGGALVGSLAYFNDW